MKVLVVTTDQRVSLQVANALVDGSDTQILEVRTPQRALQVLLSDESFDAVVADNDTAPTGGFALARDIKAQARMDHRMPPVVLLIARDQDKFLAKWSEADVFVHKPADPFNLNAVVAALVAGTDVPDLPGVGATKDLPDVLQAPDGSVPSSVGTAGY